MRKDLHNLSQNMTNFFEKFVIFRHESILRVQQIGSEMKRFDTIFQSILCSSLTPSSEEKSHSSEEGNVPIIEI
jgi:hypothetical protein